MKNLKKAVVFVLLLTIVLGFSGCGTFETKILKGAKNMQELENFHADVDADIDMTMSVLKQELKLDMNVNARSDINVEPFKMYTELESELMGMGGRVYSFVEKIGEDYYMYSSDDGKYWEKTRLEAEDEPADINVMGLISLVAEYASGFEEAGEENIRGYETQRYDGNITSDNLLELAELLGGAEILSEAAGEDVDLEEALSSCNESFVIPTSIWLDKRSGMLIKFELDITEMTADIMKLAMREIMLEKGSAIPDVGLDISIEKTLVDVTLSKFDEVGDIKHPDAA